VILHLFLQYLTIFPEVVSLNQFSQRSSHFKPVFTKVFTLKHRQQHARTAPIKIKRCYILLIPFFGRNMIVTQYIMFRHTKVGGHRFKKGQDFSETLLCNDSQQVNHMNHMKNSRKRKKKHTLDGLCNDVVTQSSNYSFLHSKNAGLF